jgi:DNA mismatch repair ATPase MutS
MKAFLMHRDRDFDPDRPPPPGAQELRHDLDLDTLQGAMAQGDEFLFDVAARALLASLGSAEEIAYRQAALRDCLANAATVRELYELAVEAIGSERRVYFGFFSRSPGMILHRSVEVLELLLESLRRLRGLAEERAGDFRSEAFARFFAMLREELDDAYLDELKDHLKRLRFAGGVPVAAGLGAGNRGRDYVLLEPPERKRGLIDRVSSLTSRPPGYTYQLPDRDEAGSRALGELRDRGIHLVANAAAQATDHVTDFFAMLRLELGFYVGALNLHRELAAREAPTCFPEVAAGGRPLGAAGLYDACLSLRLGEGVVGNDLAADGRPLTIVTGANQGGKSTFLRSVGLAQLMMQAGIFVAADSFRAELRDGVFTHFKREEDETMRSGKLDEELARMSEILDALTPDGLLLCNESFAATNEREGSEIARQIVRPLTDAGVRVLFVTHLYELAHGFYVDDPETALFLRAERRADGRRTFRLLPGEPLPTSYGEDVYRRVFGAAEERTGGSNEKRSLDRQPV